ncbi:MAG: DUF4397 domain-containing protein [Acidimicrobiia bacterium]|nr:DUF4397 domain-containing protein [Acidimicrobiia bacterium]
MKKSIFAALAVVLSLLMFAMPSSAQSDGARVHLIHGIPGVDVDVYVDGAAVFEGFSFSDTQDLSSFAGQTLTAVQVKAAGADDVLIDAGDLAVPASGNYTVFAHLDADGNPAIAVFENDVSTIEAGNGRLVVRHAAAAPAVDVKANGEVAFSNLANGAEASADLPAGTISAEVVPTGADEPVVIGPADLPITEGASLIVYATGSLDDGLEVITESITDLGPTPTAVNTGDSPVDQGLPIGLALAAVAGAVALLGGGSVARRLLAKQA